ncbi:MAG: cation diffusion facilitator family transporter [Alphaproteobacteria bacterium]
MSQTTHAHDHLRPHVAHADMTRPERRHHERRLWIAFGLTSAFMLAEAVGGVLTGSLALLADAGHMFNDAIALGVAVFAARGRRPADAKRSYGYARIQVLTAFANGVGLIFIAAFIGIEAVRRLEEPVHILSGPMFAIAVGGLFVNLICLWLLSTTRGKSLNIRSALAHVVGDFFGSLAAILAAGLVMWQGWNAADPILSIFVAALIIAGTGSVLWESAHILLEGTPRGLEAEAVIAALRKKIPAIADIHDVHIWSLDTDEPLITLHAVLHSGADREVALAAIQDHLAATFRIHRATVQIEGGTCTMRRAPLRAAR